MSEQHQSRSNRRTYEEILHAAESNAVRRLERIAMKSKDEGKAMKACAMLIALSRGKDPEPVSPASGAGKNGASNPARVGGISEDLRKALDAANVGDEIEEVEDKEIENVENKRAGTGKAAEAGGDGPEDDGAGDVQPGPDDAVRDAGKA